jgi:hypothetical protein
MRPTAYIATTLLFDIIDREAKELLPHSIFIITRRYKRVEIRQQKSCRLTRNIEFAYPFPRWFTSTHIDKGLANHRLSFNRKLGSDADVHRLGAKLWTPAWEGIKGSQTLGEKFLSV